MQRFFTTVIVGAVMAVLISGCGRDQHQPPPLERNRLVLRLFHSMKAKDAPQAIVQAERIQSMNTESTYLRTVIDAQTANLYLLRAQRNLDNGDAENAFRTLQDGAARNPFNMTLRAAADEVQKLVRIERLARDVSGAGDSRLMKANFKLLTASGKDYATIPGYHALLENLKQEIGACERKEELNFRLTGDAICSLIEVESPDDAERRTAARAENMLPYRVKESKQNVKKTVGK